jgi:repressor LexA
VKPLAPRQADVLRAIGRFLREHGYAPSFREIAEAIGIRRASTSSAITDHLNRLEAKGYLRRAPLKSRAIAITEAGFAWLDSERAATTPAPTPETTQ